MSTLNFAFQLDMPDGATPVRSEIEAMESVLPDLVAMMLERRQALSKQQRDALVELLVSEVPMKPLDMKLAKLQARALERIYSGTPWLTAEQVGTLGKHGTANPAAAAHRWKANGQLFAIRRDGRDMYPRYALGDDFTPLPVVKRVLKTLADYDSLRVAGWFESTSSFLGGKRPRELLASKPEHVVQAAQDAVVQLDVA
jgi:hypothetical protein